MFRLCKKIFLNFIIISIPLIEFLQELIKSWLVFISITNNKCIINNCEHNFNSSLYYSYKALFPFGILKLKLKYLIVRKRIERSSNIFCSQSYFAYN